MKIARSLSARDCIWVTSLGKYWDARCYERRYWRRYRRIRRTAITKLVTCLSLRESFQVSSAKKRFMSGGYNPRPDGLRLPYASHELWLSAGRFFSSHAPGTSQRPYPPSHAPSALVAAALRPYIPLILPLFYCSCLTASGVPIPNSQHPDHLPPTFSLRRPKSALWHLQSSGSFWRGCPRATFIFSYRRTTYRGITIIILFPFTTVVLSTSTNCI